jgi:hypothetical protein
VTKKKKYHDIDPRITSFKNPQQNQEGGRDTVEAGVKNGGGRSTQDEAEPENSVS